MKIIYITRHFNHSGYIILESLIQNKIPVSAILLHKKKDVWRNYLFRPFLIFLYKLKCYFYRCEQLKTLRSEEHLAKKNNIPIIWAESIKTDECFTKLKNFKPDLLVLGGGWHELIPARVFKLAKYGCINTHPSLLPEFRGTSITRWQVLHGVSKSGSTIHYVNDEFDSGGVLAQKEILVKSNWTPQFLFYKLGHAGADIMIPLLKKFAAHGKLQTKHVKHNKIYYQYYSRWKWDLEKLEIDWSKTISEIHFFILANTQECYNYLGPTTVINNMKVIIRKTELDNTEENVDSDLDSIPFDRLYVFKILDEKIYLKRKGISELLIIDLVQKYDYFYKLRRATKANKVLNLKKFDVI